MICGILKGKKTQTSPQYHVCSANCTSILIYLYTVFQELRSEIELEVFGDTEELQMSFTAICPNGTVLPDLRSCSHVKPGETVSCFALNFPLIFCICAALFIQASSKYYTGKPIFKQQNR